MKKYLLAFVLLSFFLIENAFAYVVVANKDFPVDKISKSDLKMIFLCQKSDVGGKKITPFIFDEGVAIHKEFCADIVSKSISQLSMYYKNMIFTGKGVPPKAFTENKDMLAMISGTSGAIGYVDTPDSSVKVITVTE